MRLCAEGNCVIVENIARQKIFKQLNNLKIDLNLPTKPNNEY